MKEKNTISINCGFWPSTILTLILILMQYLHIINWSWIWLLIPYWGPFAIFMIIVFLWLCCMFLVGFIEFIKEIKFFKK